MTDQGRKQPSNEWDQSSAVASLTEICLTIGFRRVLVCKRDVTFYPNGQVRALGKESTPSLPALLGE